MPLFVAGKIAGLCVHGTTDLAALSKSSHDNESDKSNRICDLANAEVKKKFRSPKKQCLANGNHAKNKRNQSVYTKHGFVCKIKNNELYITSAWLFSHSVNAYI